jgi:hypothetical protein
VNGARLHTFGGAWLHAGADARAQCQVFEDGHLPFLNVEGAAAGLSVFLPGPRVTADHLRFARELATEARRFADECERLHAAQAGQSSQGPGAACGTDK